MSHHKVYQNEGLFGHSAFVKITAIPGLRNQPSSAVTKWSASSLLSECLLQIGPSETWQKRSVGAILSDHSTQIFSNLYIDELIWGQHGLNQFFARVHKLLSSDSYFALRIITAENIKFDIQQQYASFLFPFYYGSHFLLRRVLPKLNGFRKISRLLGLPVDISKAEIIGRLIYNGFSIVSVDETNKETIVIAKINIADNPSVSKPLPNEGFLFRMQRVGQHGKPIVVFKLRSMHPYAEYVQDYLHRTNGIDKGGKFKNDFRVSTGGRFIRKYWLDELPMLINLLRGEVKLIGVRPISEHYFTLYPPSVQQVRRKHKPGLLPPFYADLPTTFDEIVASEVKYLEAYERQPLQTDLRYLKKILANIIIRRVRSK